MSQLVSTIHARQCSLVQVKAAGSADDARRKETEKSRDGALTWEVAQPLEVNAVSSLCPIDEHCDLIVPPFLDRLHVHKLMDHTASVMHQIAMFLHTFFSLLQRKRTTSFAWKKSALENIGKFLL